MDTTNYDKLRTVILRPYKRGMGPTFSLTMWDMHKAVWPFGKSLLAYRLRMNGRTLFEGEDFEASPMHSLDSDATIAGLMSFLTLRPGDTDPEYFEDYTDAQLLYCEEHAEALACYVMDRFGED